MNTVGVKCDGEWVTDNKNKPLSYVSETVAWARLRQVMLNPESMFTVELLKED